jgi:hypothetical protein
MLYLIALGSRLGLALILMLLATGRALADDGGAWLWLEYRLPVAGLPPRLPRLSMRLFSDTRFSAAAGGLAQQFLRVGPIFEVTSWLFLGVHGTIYADRLADGTFDQEARLEVEPNFNWRIGRFTFHDRNRLEYRWREERSRVRYRNQVRISYAPVGAKYIPFIWDEVLFDLTDGFNENRFMTGLGFMLNSHIRLDLGYMLRTRLVEGDWQQAHLGVVYLFVGLPSKPKTK